jgi:transcriptional regulator with XRE-family HTH domain
MPTLGERLRELREQRRLTQEELASKAKLSKGFLSDIENSKRNVGAEYLLRIATTLGTSVDYLLTGKEDDDMLAQAPVVVPRELSEYAEAERLSYQETMELLSARNSVVARRSNQETKKLSVEDWRTLHRTLKGLFG